MGRPEKFTALREYLEKKAKLAHSKGERKLHMTFQEIEQLGPALPKSAYNYIAWWYNDNYARPWSSARFKPTDVNLQAQQVTFRYVGKVSEKIRADEWESLQRKREQAQQDLLSGPASGIKKRLNEMKVKKIEDKIAALGEPPGLAEEPGAFKAQAETDDPKSPHIRHPAYGAMKGYIRLVAGTDLTEPADPEWGESVWGGRDDKGK